MRHRGNSSRIARFSSDSSLDADDATRIICRTSNIFSSLIDTFYLMGSLPWDENNDPKVLYHFPSYSDDGEILLPFIFPYGIKKETLKLRSDQYMKAVFDDSYISEAEYYPLYFPQNTNAPYVFCLFFKANQFNVPSFGHNLSGEDIFRASSPKYLQYSQFCFCIKTNLPYNDLFESLLRWILQSQRVSILVLSPSLDDFLHHSSNSSEKYIPTIPCDDFESILGSNTLWPNGQRNHFIKSIPIFFLSPPPDEGNKFQIDISPYPPFNWTRPLSHESSRYLAISLLSIIIQQLPPKVLLHIFTGLLLERTIVIYSKKAKIVASFILALNFLLRPLRWAGTSISILPPSLFELLSSPAPLLAGVLETPSESSFEEEDIFFVNLEKNRLTSKNPLTKLPNHSEMLSQLENIMKAKKSKKSDDQDITTPEIFTKAEKIMDLFHKVIQYFLDAAEKSVISDFSDMNRVKSHFLDDIFLERLTTLPQRVFGEQLMHTQMFRLHIEQTCRKRSDSLKRSPCLTHSSSNPSLTAQSSFRSGNKLPPKHK